MLYRAWHMGPTPFSWNISNLVLYNLYFSRIAQQPRTKQSVLVFLLNVQVLMDTDQFVTVQHVTKTAITWLLEWTIFFTWLCLMSGHVILNCKDILWKRLWRKCIFEHSFANDVCCIHHLYVCLSTPKFTLKNILWKIYWVGSLSNMPCWERGGSHSRNCCRRESVTTCNISDGWTLYLVNSWLLFTMEMERIKYM